MTERERELLGWIRENPMISQQELAQHAGITRSSVAVHISNLMKKGLIRGKGYVLQTSPYIAVCGCIGIAVRGECNTPLIPGIQASGSMRLLPSGAARNIAHALTLLGIDVKLISAFGEDFYADELRRDCRERKLDTTASLSVSGGHTAVLVQLNDTDGIAFSATDESITAQLTPEFFAGRMEFINKAQLCIVDASLTQDSLEYLASHCTCPLFVTPVSPAYTTKLRAILGHIHTLLPTMAQAELLTGCRTPDAAAARLLAQGIRRVFILLGDAGVLYADRREMRAIPAFSGTIVNADGANDSFLAALAWAYLQELPPQVCAQAGLAAAAICTESAESVSNDTSAGAILARMGTASEGYFPNL